MPRPLAAIFAAGCRAISAVEYGVLGPFPSARPSRLLANMCIWYYILPWCCSALQPGCCTAERIHHTFKSQADVVAMWSIESLYEERSICEDMCIYVPDSLFLSHQSLNFLPNHRSRYRSFCFHVIFFSRSEMLQQGLRCDQSQPLKHVFKGLKGVSLMLVKISFP